MLFSVKLRRRYALLSMLSYARSYKIITMFNMLLKDSPKFFSPMSFFGYSPKFSTAKVFHYTVHGLYSHNI